MRLARVDPWTRRMVTFAAAGLYMLTDIAEQFLEPEMVGEADIFDFHHLLQVGVTVLVVWCLASEIRLVDRIQGKLEAERSRRRRLAEDLSGYIAARFETWRLTDAETEIAWLLIKGFSFNEIADLRGVREKTLRQQASTIYGKADVKGRSELAAAFMEDLIGASADGDIRKAA